MALSITNARLRRRESSARPWPDAIDQVLDGDHVVMLAHATPANGVVFLPLTNFGVRNREAGTVTVNSSVGVWTKLYAIRRNLTSYWPSIRASMRATTAPNMCLRRARLRFLRRFRLSDLDHRALGTRLEMARYPTALEVVASRLRLACGNRGRSGRPDRLARSWLPR
jgi:hypothetical protein